MATNANDFQSSHLHSVFEKLFSRALLCLSAPCLSARAMHVLFERKVFIVLRLEKIDKRGISGC